MNSKRVAKTVWLSDIHLGTEMCQDGKLLAFLKSFESEDSKTYNLDTLYLVGDIIDMVQMNHKIFWSRHRTIIKKFIRMADKGVNVIYIRGNHDYFLEPEFLKESPEGVEFNGITIKMNDIYTTVRGQRMLVLHGDEFDGVVRAYPVLYALGDRAYKMLITLNSMQNNIRRLFRLKEWSFAHYVKTKAKNVVNFVASFETSVAAEAERQNVKAVIAGHIHVPKDTMIGDVRYINCGTWCELTSFVAEDHDGNIKVEIIDWNV